MRKVIINPDTIHPPVGDYSQVVVTPPGRLAFISGQVGVGRQGNIVGKGDIKAQARQALENLKAAVEAAGGNLADIASVTVFVIDMAHFGAIHEVRRQFFPADYPASTLVQVSRLAHPDLLIEINAVAALE
jgi:2-iminobutanoate/2-iminopropanoate deaminase